jgi:hypothetical protein
MTRDILTSGTVLLTVKLPETFVLARRLMGDVWHDEYRYRLERVENEHGPATIFLSTYTTNDRYPDKPGRYVYTGVVHPLKGHVRLTAKSAFPAHATRVRVADRVLAALFAGRKDAIDAAGWSVECEVVKELAGRF